MKSVNLFVETVCQQASCGNEAPCGDRFLQHRFPTHGHTVVVLSDGMGHGIKANLLSTLTASIFMGMAGAPHPIETTARTVMQTLPVCRVRKISYSTFTLIDIDHRQGVVHLIEYDNPQAFVFRRGEPLPLEREAHPYTHPQTGRMQTFYTSSFRMERGDRVVAVTDGVTQSGMGREGYDAFGWGRVALGDFLVGMLTRDGEMTPRAMASAVVERAVENDGGVPCDDISCTVIHIRQPRQVLLCSCPPSLSSDVERIAQQLRTFVGGKIVCGYHLAQQIADSWGVTPHPQLSSTDPELPPQWVMEGVDLVSEGLLTLSKVLEILEHYTEQPTGRGPAYHICELLLAADRIEMVIGMRKSNTAAADTEALILRRKVLGSIGHLLEREFAKQVEITYL